MPVIEIGAITRNININPQRISPTLAKETFTSGELDKIDKPMKTNGTTIAKTTLMTSFFDVTRQSSVANSINDIIAK